ncbi:50S ribosomal protein L2 [Candidatus Nesciobacter abundans]|uniref:Large ribosomal subunit protein uL2 n=1 Tax=Candidatus Nesciobacter abundans TaxID=2601668 RepID=A0A5C0UJC1_9PROT|nr:50S ribosomal protein L2 [Candidatus Nesciobacter abundans]QEK38904.1 50S ribosomal protein L2 [Candidatus Nesciobacter abundans]|eukprot:TRINITY_DN15575_c0_g1_i1.p1 TRINITY_DN15575_c0_g1~~TRINITY_DN15575_c0_g1_i1.p1  ORF type:complete len:275 (+),score=-38.90 TRINITY_DN15575_c0_g1_i1:236-1060(+)
MNLKVYKPSTPSSRHTKIVDKRSLWSGKPEKSLVKGVKKTGGRNSDGRITSRHIGGGSRKIIRNVEFYPAKLVGLSGTVERIEYDPGRTAFIALVKFSDEKLRYIVAPESVKIGDTIECNEKSPVSPGNIMTLKNVPYGTIVHNVEFFPGQGAKIGRSAGSEVSVLGSDGDHIVLRLKSGEIRKFDSRCFCSIGQVSNLDNKNVSLGKAGRKRWKGIRPSVRGVAMNPVDHPHGGGEGKTSGGRHPVSPWGQNAKGLKTRKKSKKNKMIVRRRA